MLFVRSQAAARSGKSGGYLKITAARPKWVLSSCKRTLRTGRQAAGLSLCRWHAAPVDVMW